MAASRRRPRAGPSRLGSPTRRPSRSTISCGSRSACSARTPPRPPIRGAPRRHHRLRLRWPPRPARRARPADRRPGRYLAGQSVELVCHDGLVEVFHDAVLVATHARRHLPEQEERVLKQALAAAPKRPASDRVVVRKVDRNGSVSFAGANYRVGNAFRGRQVEVSLAGDTVQIWSDDRSFVRTRPDTTAGRSMAPLRTQVAGRTGSMQPSTLHHMSYRCRSRSVVRVPRSHTHTSIRGWPSQRSTVLDLDHLLSEQSVRPIGRWLPPDGCSCPKGAGARPAVGRSRLPERPRTPAQGPLLSRVWRLLHEGEVDDVGDQLRAPSIRIARYVGRYPGDSRSRTRSSHSERSRALGPLTSWPIGYSR